MLVSAAWIGPAILGAIQVAAEHRIWGSEGPVDVRRVLFVSIDWLFYALLTPGVFFLSRRYPLARPRLARHAAMHLGFSLLFCVVWAGLGTVLRVLLDPRGLESGAAVHFLSWLFITLPFGVAVYLAVVGIEHAIRYFEQAREQETQVARLSEQLTGARLAALQAQLNPHFLFNSLNTIAVLVRDGNGPAATRVIDQLSEVLRRTLSDIATNEVSLGDELELVAQYLAVEQARFSDRLRPVLDADRSLLAAAVPRFAIQHLVENAIRHGITRRSDAGRIHVSARRDGDSLEISVTDDGPGIGEETWPPGHGLANTRERLHTLYGARASLSVSPAPRGGTIAVLRIPYHEVLLERRVNEG
jgi:signal transduction histidine kinase